jgi:predicted O-methyltransferase YrrM
MQFIDPALEAYASARSASEPAHLRALAEATQRQAAMPQMLSGHLQGRFLSLLSHLLRPGLVLDIGTFTGYSALCMAEGLGTGGLVHTIDVVDRHLPLLQQAAQDAWLADRIQAHTGQASEIIPRLVGTFDLVFIDADKENYITYFDLVVDRVRPGGLIVADNVLWSGRVLEPQAAQDSETRALAAYAEHVQAHARVENLLLPLRDGLLVSRRT